MILAAFIVVPNKNVKAPDNSSNIETKTYPVTGYYTSYIKRMEYDGEFYGTTSCDAFIEIRNSNPLITYLRNLVTSGNTVNSLTTEGNLRMNIDISKLDQSLRNKIIQSLPDKKITLEMKLRETEGKENISCGSFVRIVR
jgi:hypothetical protein